MTDDLSPRDIARRIVNSADQVAYLADALGKVLPGVWRYGPCFEVRLRFRPRLSELDDAELARRLDAIGITGPLRPQRIEAVAQRLALEPGDLLTGGSWRPRGFGLWRLDDGTGMGVKAYVSSRPGVDLLLAVPPGFLEPFGGRGGFPYWRQLAERPQKLDGLARLCRVLLQTLRRAQPLARVEAAHLQDQAWCEGTCADDHGAVVPAAVASALAWASTPSSRAGWARVPLGHESP